MYFHSGVLNEWPPAAGSCLPQHAQSFAERLCAHAVCPTCGHLAGLVVARRGLAHCAPARHLNKCLRELDRHPELAGLLKRRAAALHELMGWEALPDDRRLAIADRVRAAQDEFLRHRQQLTDRYPKSLHFEQLPPVVVSRYRLRSGLTEDEDLITRFRLLRPETSRQEAADQVSQARGWEPMQRATAEALAEVLGIPVQALTEPGTWEPPSVCLPPLPEQERHGPYGTPTGYVYRTTAAHEPRRFPEWHGWSVCLYVPDYSRPSGSGSRAAWTEFVAACRIDRDGEQCRASAVRGRVEATASGATEPEAVDAFRAVARDWLNRFEAMRWGRQPEPLPPLPSQVVALASERWPEDRGPGPTRA